MARRKGVRITRPGGAAEAEASGDAGDDERSAAGAAGRRVALTLKVDEATYARLMALKGRRREPLQRWLERVVHHALDAEDV